MSERFANDADAAQAEIRRRRTIMTNRRLHAGNALLAVVVLALLAASAALAAASHLQRQAERRMETNAAARLAQAKAALLGYAVNYPEIHPGQGVAYLPCPDENNDGSSPGVNCRARDHGVLGRFPYRTLGLPEPFDGHGQCLWYAVAGSFKNMPKPLMLNWDSPGQFEIVDTDGRVLGGEGHSAVAALFAPGPPLPGQARPSTAANLRCPGSASVAADLSAFLERPYGDDLTGDVDLIHGLPGSDVNDVLAWLTVDEVFAAVRRRPDFSASIDALLDAVAAALSAKFDAAPPEPPSPTLLAQFLATHAEATIGLRAHGRLPDAATLGIGDAAQAFYDNWRDQLRFVACTDGSACLTAVLADAAPATPAETENCRALVLFGGERQRGDAPQHRRNDGERADAAQYLEGDNLASFTTGTGNYAGFRHYAVVDPDAPASEDLIRCVH